MSTDWASPAPPPGMVRNSISPSPAAPAAVAVAAIARPLPDPVEQGGRRRIQVDELVTDVDHPAQRVLEGGEGFDEELVAVTLIEPERVVRVGRALRVALADPE